MDEVDGLIEVNCDRLENDRLRDTGEMGDVLGYARVSTGDQDVAGQTMRLEKATAIRVFTDVRSSKTWSVTA